MLLYLYDRKAVTKIAQAKSLSKLTERTADSPEYNQYISQKTKEIFTDEWFQNLTILALNPKRETKIMIAAAISYSIGFILYMAYFAYALLTDP